MRPTILILTLFLIFGKTMAQDSGPIITDRPDQTEASSTVGKHVFQLETGTLLEMTPGMNSWAINTSLFRYGLTENFELRINTDLFRNNNTSNDIQLVGMGDLQIGLKYRFLEGSFEGAFLSHVLIPSGTKELKGLWGTSNKILLSHDITDRISFGYNLGYEYYETDIHNLVYTYAIGFGLTKKVGFFTEIYGDWTNFDTSILSYDNGITYLILDNLQVDFSFGLGINHDYHFYSLGLSWKIHP